MRPPVLWRILPETALGYVDRVEFEKVGDEEKYVRVPAGGYYLVLFLRGRKVVGERVLKAERKVVCRGSKRYVYTYLRIRKPWSSVAGVTGATIYALRDPRAEEEYKRYLKDERRYSLKRKAGEGITYKKWYEREMSRFDEENEPEPPWDEDYLMDLELGEYDEGIDLAAEENDWDDDSTFELEQDPFD